MAPNNYVDNVPAEWFNVVQTEVFFFLAAVVVIRN
jgi:hypothetical protein